MNYGDFHGLKTVVLENEHFRLECLAEAGPRIVRLIPTWTGENLFAEVPDVTVRTDMGEYHYYGGHRLWCAPESLSRTYVVDDHGLTVRHVQDGIRLAGALEPKTGLRKTVSIQMSSSRPALMVKHKIENQGRAVARLSPWALTMMRQQGKAFLPQQYSSADSDGLAPNRRFALWPYSRWDDPRLRLGDDFILIKSEYKNQPFKFGYFNPHGWLGYLYDDAFFIKRFGVRSDEQYADFGCNAEVYTNHRSTELGSLGPIVDLAPREEVIHTETWEVYKDTEVPKDLLGGKTLEELLSQDHSMNSSSVAQ